MQGEEEETASEKDCEFGRIYRIRHGHCCDCCCCCYIPPPFRRNAISLFTAAICSTFVPIRRFQQRLFLFLSRCHSLYTHDDDDDVGHMNGQNGCQKRGCGGDGGRTQCENECVARLLLILRLADGTQPERRGVSAATLFYTSPLPLS